MRSGFRRRRAADLILVALAAPIWVPIMGLLACMVLITSGRPVLFIQDRVGHQGNTFAMRKFRSMKNGNNPLIPDPDRITTIGSVLRRTSLDELPQLFNVIDGSMSLVGPRPILPQQVAGLSANQRNRMTVLPGLTGLAQVNGRNSLSWDERFAYDLEWASNPTLRCYATVLTKTASTVLSGDGVTGHDANDRFVVDLAPAAIDLDEKQPSAPIESSNRQAA